MARKREGTSASQDAAFLRGVIHPAFRSSFLEDVVDWISDALPPEQVFSDSQLDEWAVANGYEKEV